MKLTRYLNVSDESFDSETIKIMESLEVETSHHEAIYEDVSHPIGQIGEIIISIKEPAQFYQSLKLLHPGNNLQFVKKNRHDTVLYLGLVYELRIVKVEERLRNTSIHEEQKVLSRSLFLKCLTSKCSLIYFQISLPVDAIIEDEADQFIQEYFDSHFRILR